VGEGQDDQVMSEAELTDENQRTPNDESPVLLYATIVCVCSIFVTLFPFLWCPCNRVPWWLRPLSLTGGGLWALTSLFGIIASNTRGIRALWIISLLIALLGTPMVRLAIMMSGG
jgi:hypothetical protein